MQSSNPAFRNLNWGAGNGAAPTPALPAPTAEHLQQMYNQPPGYAPVRERYLTIDDVVTKTATTLGVGILAAVATMLLTDGWWPVLPTTLIGLVLSLIVIFKQSTNPALILGYSVAEGVALGGITGAFESIPGYQGIGLQALVATLGVFAGMLVVYKTGAIRVTPKFSKFMLGALIGTMVLVVFRLIFAWVMPNSPMSSGGGLSILISVVIIVVAALSFLLDFDQIDKAIRAGAPAQTAWYFAFSLMVTLVWLYLEILRLLGYLRSE